MSVILKMQDGHYQQILEAALKDPKLEICGLLGGVRDGEMAIVKQVISIPNIATNREHTFVMSPVHQVKAMLAFEQAGLDVVGIYHSHPTDNTTPSPTDLASHFYDEAFLVIVSPHLHVDNFAAWFLVPPIYHVVPIEIMS